MYQYFEFSKLEENPLHGDIYIFEGDNVFSLYFVDTVFEDSIYFFGYPYKFKKAVPTLEDINENLFNNNIHYIYGQSEIDRLVSENTIIKIYR
ncbi:MAG: hypothetical protein AB8B74_11985 [Crocinitomicaceae bacterium]